MRKRVLSHETGRKRARPGRVARTSATARATVFLLVAFTVLANFAPVRAFASIYNNPTVTWTSLQSCVVNGPNNEFDAALAIIERTSTKIQISEPMFVELSNEGTGGRFYELAQSLKCAADETPGSGDFVLESSVAAGVMLYGADYVWWQHGITANDELLSGALEDYETILNGGHLGGGGASDIPGYVAIGGVQVPCAYPNSSIVAYDDNGSNSKSITFEKFSQNFNNTLYIKSESQAYIDSIKQGSPVFIMANTNYSSGLVRGLSLQVFTPRTSETRFTFTISDSNTNSRCSYSGSVTKFSNYQNVQFRYTGTGENEHYYLICNSTFSSSNYYSSGSNSYDTFQWWYSDGSSGGGSGGGGGGGNNNWPAPTEPTPDPPDAPDPIDPPSGGTPEVPEPGNPTEPVTPQPSTPTTNVYVNVQEPTNTSPTDYTPWLRAILNAINNLGDKLDDESLEIQRALNTFYTNLVTTLKNISGSFLHDLTSWGRLQMEWLAQDLQYSLTMFGADLTEYLDDLARWIVQNLNYDFPNSDFDDSSIVYWLKRIWMKLGSDNINTRPTDPTQEPDGFLDWVRRVIQEFILGLGASASDVVSDIGDLLSRLFAKFPFSVPWEILGILQLLDAPAVTPRVVIDVPITIGSWHTSYTFDINLSPYDSAMATARGVFLILFCSWLLWLTPQVLRDLSPEDFL